MLKLTLAPLQVDKHCRLVSCHFDQRLQEKVAIEFGIALPVSLSGAAEKRKAEFFAGRFCALTALNLLQIPRSTTSDVEIKIGENREPLWPKGIVGSITHTKNYASSVVAYSSNIRAIGLDSETWIKPECVQDVARQILTDLEDNTDHLHLFDSPRHHLTLIFSAKESLFKCLFPLVNRFFDFHSAVITPLPSRSRASGEFRFELLEDLNTEFRAGYSGLGSYAMDATCIHTKVVLKAGKYNSLPIRA